MLKVYQTLNFITVYSSPTLDCGTEPCGIEAGEVGESDSVKAIIEVKNRVASFYIGDSDANLGDFTPPTVENQYLYFDSVGYPATGTVVATLEKNTDVSSYVFKETGTTVSSNGFIVNERGEITITQAGIDDLKKQFEEVEGCNTTSGTTCGHWYEDTLVAKDSSGNGANFWAPLHISVSF